MSTATLLDIERDTMAPIPLGMDADGQVVTMPMPGDGGRHALIAGASGAGKTTCIHCILLTVAARKHVSIVLIDPKEIDFAVWEERSAMMALGEPAAPTAFAHVMAELSFRKAVLGEHNRRRAAKRLPPLLTMPIGTDLDGHMFDYLLVTVDELESLTDPESNPEAKTVRGHLARGLRMGRAVNIGFLLGTQRPAYSVVPTKIRDLCRTRVVLGTESVEQTKVAWGDGYQELQPHPPHRFTQIGETFIRVDRAATHFQGFYPTPDQIAAGAWAYPCVPGPASWPRLVDASDNDSCPLCGHRS